MGVSDKKVIVKHTMNPEDNKVSPEKLKRQRNMVISGALLLSTLTILLGVMFLGKLSTIQDSWREFNRSSTEITKALRELDASLGYGGMIHDFKNYVIRHNDKYKRRTEQSIKDVELSLNTLQNLDITPSDLQALEDIKQTVFEYKKQFKNLIDMSQELNAEQLDTRVKVDDSKAFAALKLLTENILSRSKLKEQETSTSLNDAISLLLFCSALIPVIFFVAVIIDRSLKKILEAHSQLHNAHQRIDELFDLAPDAMMVLNQNGHIIKVNKQASKLLEYQESELLSLTAEDLMHPDLRHSHIGLRKSFFNNPSSKIMGVGRSLTTLTKSGKEIISEISLSHSGQGKQRLATIIIRDITEKEINRRQLSSAKQSAEEALVQLQNAQETLVQSEKLAALGGLVAGVAHEINTPIGMTLSSATHLEGETRKLYKLYQEDDLGVEDLEHYIDTTQQATGLMVKNISRASDLIQSFKQVAVDSTGGECRLFDLHLYLLEIVNNLTPQLKKTNINVAISCPDKLIMNSIPGALAQTITNLITNSLAHAFDSQEKGNILISGQLTDNEMVYIHYQDDGKGIPKEHQQKIFDPFFTTQRGEGGSGLGLHIIHNLVTGSLNGKIKFSSQVDKGTHFYLSLPQNMDDNQAEVDSLHSTEVI